MEYVNKAGLFSTKIFMMIFYFIQGAVSDGGQVQKSRSNGALRRGRPLEKFGPELNFNVVESETLRESRRKYKILYVSSLKSSDISRQVLQVHVS